MNSGVVPGPAVLPWWARPAGYAGAILALTLPRLVAAFTMGLYSDEAYYALWSLQPGAGYYDHAPGIAWVIAAGRALFGEGLFAVRSVTLLAGFVAFALIYRLGALLFSDARIGALAGMFYAVSLAVAYTFNMAFPDGISVLFWLATLWATAEFAARGNPWWWLAAGAFAGLGLLSKYLNVFLGAGLLLYLLTAAERRRWFGLWQLWVGGVLALVLFLPVVWWNAGHDWISFRFQLGRSTLGQTENASATPFLLYWGTIALLMLPPAFLLTLGAFPAWVRRTGSARGLDLPILTSLPILLFFAVHSLVQVPNPNWVATVFPPLMLVAAWAAISVRPRLKLLRWPVIGLSWLQVPLGLVLVTFLSLSLVLGEIPGLGMRKFVSYGSGWNGVARELAALAEVNGAKWIDTEWSFELASLAGYALVAEGHRLPVYQTTALYRYTFPEPQPDLLETAHLKLVEIDTGSRPPPDPALVGIIDRRDDVHVLGSYAVYLVPAP